MSMTLSLSSNLITLEQDFIFSVTSAPLALNYNSSFTGSAGHNMTASRQNIFAVTAGEVQPD